MKKHFIALLIFTVSLQSTIWTDAEEFWNTVASGASCTLAQSPGDHESIFPEELPAPITPDTEEESSRRKSPQFADRINRFLNPPKLRDSGTNTDSAQALAKLEEEKKEDQEEYVDCGPDNQSSVAKPSEVEVNLSQTTQRRSWWKPWQ